MTDLGIITDMRLAAFAEVVMANLVRTNLRRTILIGATLALSIGTSMTAFAQPGASFQTRSNREADGVPGVPSVLSRTKLPPEAYREWDGTPRSGLNLSDV